MYIHIYIYIYKQEKLLVDVGRERRLMQGGLCKKINRSQTHTHRQRTTPPTPTHGLTLNSRQEHAGWPEEDEE